MRRRPAPHHHRGCAQALDQAQVFSIYHRAYDANSGGTGVQFIRAPTTVSIDAHSFPALVGFWPLDGDGKDISGHGLSGKPINADWVAGLYNLAFRFDGDDAMHVTSTALLDVATVTMSAWVRPVEYDVAGDRGIIMNKEGSYEVGLEDGTGALQGAFSPCWRWFGTTRVPAHEWTHVAASYDGVSESHYVAGQLGETDPCGTAPN